MNVALRNTITGLYYDGTNFSAKTLADAKVSTLDTTPIGAFDAFKRLATSVWSNAEVVEVKLPVNYPPKPAHTSPWVPYVR